jgi:hypothetical protein
VALLPPIPDRPADRPETWAEYLSRRAIVAMHRQFADELAAFVVDAPPFTVDDVVKSFGRFAEAYEFKRKPQLETVLIDGDVIWRDDAVRRLLADPGATNLFFIDAGDVLQATNVDIDLAPELKELIPPAEAKWIDEEIERLGSALVSLAYANGLRILNGE